MRRFKSVMYYVRVPRPSFCQRLCEKGKPWLSFPEIDWSRLLPGEIPFFGYSETYQMTVETYENNGSPILALLFFNDAIARINFLIANIHHPTNFWRQSTSYLPNIYWTPSFIALWDCTNDPCLIHKSFGESDLHKCGTCATVTHFRLQSCHRPTNGPSHVEQW